MKARDVPHDVWRTNAGHAVASGSGTKPKSDKPEYAGSISSHVVYLT
jgi:hypothetical protein